MNHSGKNGYVRESWGGNASLQELERYIYPATASGVAHFRAAAANGDYDRMVEAANDLRRVSTRLLSFARMKQRQKRKQEAPQNASSVGV
jgi:hypothetical protein